MATIKVSEVGFQLSAVSSQLIDRAGVLRLRSGQNVERLTHPSSIGRGYPYQSCECKRC